MYMYQSIIEELNLHFLLQLSKGKQGSAISGVVEKECPEFVRERFYKNTSEIFHLRIYILRLIYFSS